MNVISKFYNIFKVVFFFFTELAHPSLKLKILHNVFLHLSLLRLL